MSEGKHSGGATKASTIHSCVEKYYDIFEVSSKPELLEILSIMVSTGGAGGPAAIIEMKEGGCHQPRPARPHNCFS